MNCNRAFLAKYFHDGFPKQVWIGSMQGYKISAWSLQMSLWVYEIANLKLPVTADISLPLSVQFSLSVALPRWSHPWSHCWGTWGVCTCISSCAGGAGAALIFIQRCPVCRKDAPCGCQHCLCGLLLYATSSSKMNGLNNSFQWQSQKWLLGKGYFFHFLMMWLFSMEEDWWRTVEDWQYVYQNKNTWKFKLSLLDMFHYLLYGENFKRVKVLAWLSNRNPTSHEAKHQRLIFHLVNWWLVCLVGMVQIQEVTLQVAFVSSCCWILACDLFHSDLLGLCWRGFD